MCTVDGIRKNSFENLRNFYEVKHLMTSAFLFFFLLFIFFFVFFLFSFSFFLGWGEEGLELDCRRNSKDVKHRYANT